MQNIKKYMIVKYSEDVLVIYTCYDFNVSYKICNLGFNFNTDKQYVFDYI